MINKCGFYGLLTIAVLVCGCGEGMKEGNIMNSDTYKVEMKTSMGNIVLELNAKAAPITVKNFIEYAQAGFYNNTIFHRVIPGFMIQGGGLTAEMEEKQTRDPIKNEANNGLDNVRGTISMARKNDPDSATCQFFINHVDNKPLDYVNAGRPGYAVFGKVVEGMETVDAIASVQRTRRKNKTKGYIMDDVPVKPILIKSVKVVSK
jgi:peptidyl-prolyl cis-trans isomerase A (cyclophilin A)